MGKRQPFSADPYAVNHHLLSMYKNQPPFSVKVSGASSAFTNLLRQQQLKQRIKNSINKTLGKPASPPPKNLFNRKNQPKKHKRNNNTHSSSSKKTCISNSTKAASMRNLEQALMKMPKKNLTKLILNGNF